MVDPHFEELRKRINEQLSKIDSPDAKEQITQYPWLYGALGNPRSEVVFVCENPSRTGVSGRTTRKSTHRSRNSGGGIGQCDSAGRSAISS